MKLPRSRGLRVPVFCRFMHAPAWEANPVEVYDERVSQGCLQNDPYQRKILQNISQLHHSLRTYNPPTVVTPDVDLLKPGQGYEMLISGLLRLWGSRESAKGHENVVKSIYLWGDVGCGKTMLMDLFYLTIPSHLPKRRMHFHQFMQNLHKRSHQLKSEHRADLDVIPLLASEIAQTSTVLCFDEFQVTDVADAMLLRRLLTLLLSPEYGVVLFATSNRAPDDLYLNGIQRASFIPCIQLIKNQARVIYSNSPTDYRKVPRPLLSVYYSPKPGVKYHSKTNLAACRKHVETWTEYFNQGPHARPLIENDVLTVWGRELVVPRSNRPLVAHFSFEQLCGSNMSAGDYLTLTNSLRAFIISDIPYLSIQVRDKVRRFITFLDAVYEAHGCIATTAAAPFKDLFVEPEDLKADNYQLFKKQSDSGTVETFEDDDLVVKHGYDKLVARKASMFVNDEEKFAFARALSRLTQMGTTDWISTPCDSFRGGVGEI